MGTFKDYNINWINALTGLPIVGTLENTGVSGKLELNYPQTLTGDESQPILFFEVYPQGSSFKSSQNTDTITEEHTIADKQKIETSNLGEIETEVITISPNPTTSVINVKINNSQMKQMKWILTDINGRIINSGETETPTFDIDLSVYQSGMYFLILNNSSESQQFKIIKQ